MAYRLINTGSCWRGELTLGTMAGYTGPEFVRITDLNGLLGDYDKGAFALCIWNHGTMFYGNTRETVIGISVYNPAARQAEMEEFCQGLAAYLGETFLQTRVYLDVLPVNTMVVGLS